MLDRIFEFISAYSMTNAGDTVVVGVSGGADSMCLLHCLYSLREKLNINLIVAHINHCIRGDEAMRDESFVKDYCEKLGIPFMLHRVDIPKLAKQLGIGTEECGRQERYAFFQALAKEHGGKIATAHTASDNAETLLFNIVRGSGLNGLRGIPPVRDNIIRPILCLSRADVEDYCNENGIEYVTDSTNLSNEYTRNKIRLDIIPVLKQINPNLENSFMRFSECVSDDESFLEKLARAEMEKATVKGGLKTELIQNLPLPILSRIVLIEAKKLNFKGIEKRHVDLIIGTIKSHHGCVSLPNGLYSDVSQGVFRIYKKDTADKNDSETPFMPLINTNYFTDNGYVFSITAINYKDFKIKEKINKKVFENALDCAIINFNTMLRHRRPGDYFRTRSGHTKSLKKLFNELKIPRERRNQLLLAANGSEVLWIEEIGISRSALVSADTQDIVLIKKELSYNNDSN